MTRIEKERKDARKTCELIDFLRNMLEENERYSFEWWAGGKTGAMEIYDKKEAIGYVLKIEPIDYDEERTAKNL